MGTPHQGGSGVHLRELVLKVASIFVTADDKILKHLERDSEWLQQELSQYALISHDFVTKFAYEMFPTSIVLGKTIMVCEAMYRRALKGYEKAWALEHTSTLDAVHSPPTLVDAWPQLRPSCPARDKDSLGCGRRPVWMCAPVPMSSLCPPTLVDTWPQLRPSCPARDKDS